MWILYILDINKMTQFCNIFMEWPSFLYCTVLFALKIEVNKIEKYKQEKKEASYKKQNEPSDKVKKHTNNRYTLWTKKQDTNFAKREILYRAMLCYARNMPSSCDCQGRNQTSKHEEALSDRAPQVGVP